MNKRNGLKAFGIALCFMLCLLNTSEQARFLAALPQEIYISDDVPDIAQWETPPSLSFLEESQAVQSSLSERLHPRGKAAKLRVRLFESLTLRKIDVHYRDRVWVMPGGETIGVMLRLPGALVVGLGGFFSTEGEMVSPAQAAGIRAGDMILRANGEIVENSAHLAALCAQAEGEIKLIVERNKECRELSLTPVQAAEDELFKLGMWVRDSTAGIGTLSFYEMDSLRFGALGHPVTDVDTGLLLEIGEGGISLADVVGVSYGMQGMPGELHGAFSSFDKKIGVIENNTPNGIFGRLSEATRSTLYPDGVPLAFSDEVQTGSAEILSTVDENGVRAFSCEIVRTFTQDAQGSKSMVLRIDDPALLAITGGIVQGMSGSPVMQNGKLVGVVTHVFVNDPQKGYAVYAEWMYNSMLANAS